MKTIRVVAGLLLVYAGATILNLGFWVWYTGIAEPAPRILLRTAAVVVAAIGLYRRQRWAWWLGVVITTWLVAGGIVAIASGRLSGLAERRPYPLLDYLYFILSFGISIAAPVLLLTPTSRAAVRARSAGATA